jgi:hypothetical protein
MKKQQTKTENFTDVIFRVFFDTNEVIALFPGLPGDTDTETCSSYMHVGQHGAAHTTKLLRGDSSTKWKPPTRAASPKEYADLKAELEQLGYVLNVVRRERRIHYEDRKDQLQAHKILSLAAGKPNKRIYVHG